MERLAAEPDLLALDLAAGPGSASARLLRRLPGSRSVAVDADPVLLRLGEGAQGDHGGRLRWVQADLRDPAWVDARGQDTFDAVISTTALHWLTPPEVAQVYRQLAGLLRPGGVLLNGDLLPLPAHLSRIRAAVEAVDERRQAAALAGGSQAWQDWWDTLRREPALLASIGFIPEASKIEAKLLSDPRVANVTAVKNKAFVTLSFISAGVASPQNVDALESMVDQLDKIR